MIVKMWSSGGSFPSVNKRSRISRIHDCHDCDCASVLDIGMEAVEHIPGIAPIFTESDAPASPQLAAGEPFRDGELVARFKLELDDFEVEQVARRVGATTVIRKSPLGLFELRGPKVGWVSDATLQKLWETGEVVSVSPNYTRGGLTYLPNDPHAVSGAQWYLDQVSDVDLDLPDAWNITQGSSSVVVGVMDTGIVRLHPEFIGRLWTNPSEIASNGIDDDGNGYIDDMNGWDSTSENGGDPNVEDNDGGPTNTGIGHGTWVTSILLANSNNDHQVAGFDHFAKVMVVRSLNQGSGITLSHIIGGLDYLLMNGQNYNVLNMSWVAQKFTSIENGLDALEQQDALLIAGSGNEGGSSEDWYPASHPVAVTIGATDDTDTLASFSDTGSNLNFVAPGVDIYTASFSDPQGSDSFYFDDGTSFSTPMVTGIASLGFSVRPNMTKDDLIYALKKSAVDLGTVGWDSQHGWGRVNAFEAIEVLDTLIFFGDFETGDVSRWSSSVP